MSLLSIVSWDIMPQFQSSCARRG